MKKTFLFILLAISITNGLFAQKQNYTSQNKKAVKAFEQGLENKGQEAIEYFEKAISYDSGFVEAYIALAEFYADLKNTQKSLDAYWKSVRINPAFYPMLWFTMGEMEMQQENYENAQKCYQQFLQLATKAKQETKDKAQRRLEELDFIEHCLKNPVPFLPENMGANINTENHEYFPSLTTDGQTLVFTRRSPRTEETTAPTEDEEDFYISQIVEGQWAKAQRMPPPVNTRGNEGAQCISPDGKYLYFTACSRPKSFGSCDIYFCENIGDKWSEPQNLGLVVNSTAWESQPSISPDGKTLYFSSNRLGGNGGKDLWMTQKNENGIWSEPVNLGTGINTAKDEMSPFIHPDNKTLYFSSNGHLGMGGLDIFYIRKDENGKWGKPVNIGCPINTPKDEVNLVVSPDGNKAYFSTDKLGGFGKQDIYEFSLYEEARPTAVSYLKGIVSDEKTGKKLKASFEIYNLVSGELVAQSFSDKQTGEFLISLPTGQRYALNVSAEKYLFHSESFDFQSGDSVEFPLQKNIFLKPIAIGDEIVLRNIFFENNEAALKPESEIELNKVLAFLQKNPSLKIEISGHTDNIGTAQYNLQLSENRAKSVYDYLVQHGIEAKRLSYKGFGYQKPLDSNDTEKGRANNRRTEMKVMGD